MIAAFFRVLLLLVVLALLAGVVAENIKVMVTVLVLGLLARALVRFR
jgi:hypothetical protein